MKRSIDDLTNQAIDLVLENDALHKRVVRTFKKENTSICDMYPHLQRHLVYSRDSPRSTSIDPA